jgi:hypothetical protein
MDADQASAPPPLGVEALDLVVRQAPAEVTVPRDDRLDERGVDPGVGIRLQRVVRLAVGLLPLDVLVQLEDAAADVRGELRTAVDHRVAEVEGAE